jgi:hypothetical protein
MYNLTSNNNYSIENFYEKFAETIRSEDEYFSRHEKSIKGNKKILSIIDGELTSGDSEFLTEVLANIYIHKIKSKNVSTLFNAVAEFIKGNIDAAIILMQSRLPKYGSNRFYYLLKNTANKIESLGKGIESNPFRMLSLREYILNNSHNGSFNMWEKVLNYMRLALHENRKIDIESIGLFWPMYHERKDYSVINMDVALKVFEENNFITEIDSCKLIVFTQSLSEKGVRNILADYISLHTPDILSLIENSFEIEDLNVSWEQLPPNFIDAYSGKLFDVTVKRLLQYNSYSKKIKFSDVQNLYHSNKKKLILSILFQCGYSIEIEKDNPEIDYLNKCGIRLEYEKTKDELNSAKESSEERCNKGILDIADIDYIKKKGISASEIAGFVDGYYTLLTDVDIFKMYQLNEIIEKAQEILFNAIQGKIRHINMYGRVFYFVGNIPRFLKDFSIEHNEKAIFESFVKFLKISLIWK